MTKPIDDLIAASSIGAGLADIEERGIDAHLADLEKEMAPKRKRKKSAPAAPAAPPPERRSAGAIVLEVLGAPAPKGSSRAMLIGGRARLIASSSRSNETAQNRWARAVREVALAQPDGFKDTPLTVAIEFRVRRPAAARKRAAPLVHPDLDKLTRCTLDALVTTKRKGRVHYGIIDDDSRIVRLEVTKLYAEPGNEGARITVEEWRPE